MKIVNYKVVSARSVAELQKEVINLLMLGWEPIGNVTVSHGFISDDGTGRLYFNDHYYLQTMVIKQD